MGAFDHIILLLSFVYALAIAHLLSTVAKLVRDSRRVRFSALHAFWMLNALTSILANWMSFWDLRTLPSWNVASILLTFAIASLNYLQAALVCPEVSAGERLDLAAFQADQRLRIVGSFLALGILALIANAIYGAIFGVISWNAQNLAVVPMVAGALIALIWRGRAAQILGAVVIAAAWTFYFAALQAPLH